MIPVFILFVRTSRPLRGWSEADEPLILSNRQRWWWKQCQLCSDVVPHRPHPLCSTSVSLMTLYNWIWWWAPAAHILKVSLKPPFFGPTQIVWKPGLASWLAGIRGRGKRGAFPPKRPQNPQAECLNGARDLTFLGWVTFTCHILILLIYIVICTDW